MYRYARTRNRVHRVYVEGGRAFKVEQCNLDDVGFLHLDDVVPEGQHCAYCWAGWVEPTPEQAAAGETPAQPEAESPPPGARPIPLVQSTRRLALAALVGAALLGGAAGVLASPDGRTLPVDALERRLDELVVQVQVLQGELGDVGRAAQVVPVPVTVVVPPVPAPTAVVAPVPTSQASTAPERPTASPQPTRGTGSRRSSSSTTNTTTIVVVPAPTARPPAQPTPPPAQPTPPPTPTPAPPVVVVCVRPGVALGYGDRCRWTHNR